MQAIAEVEGNTLRVMEAKQLLQRDIGPLSKEIQRTLLSIQKNQANRSNTEALWTKPTSGNNKQNNTNTYQAPTNHHFDVETDSMDALIQSSESLLRESQSILHETEYIGNETIQQLVQQREQLTNAQQSLHAVQNIMTTTQQILKSMGRRACRSRLALHMMIGTLISLNLFTLYWIYTKKYRHHSNV
jgi:uncharacterized small protein (DUF1192 family)